MTKPIWDYYRDGITQSLICKYLTCKRQCELEYYYGYTSKSIAPWFIFGNTVHYCLQHYYAANGQKKEWNQWIAEYRVILDGELKFSQQNTAVMQEIDIILKTVYKVLKIYVAYYHDEFITKNYLPTELQFKVPFLDTYLNGKLDGPYMDTAGHLNIMDHKCLFSRFDEVTFAETIRFDIQANLYALASREVYGHCPNAIVFNVLRKHGLRLKKNETELELMERAIRDIMGNPDHYFIRIPYQIVESELEEWKHNQLTPIVTEIKQWYDSGCKSYVNPLQLKTIYGQCTMYNLMVNGLEHEYFIRDKPFKELE